MASLVGAITVLALTGAPGASSYTVPTSFVRPDSTAYTRLALVGASGENYGDFTSKAATTSSSFSVSDTAYLSGTETPLDTQEITSYDTASLSVSEVVSMANQVGVVETANLSLSEVVNLGVTGVLTLTASDTASLTITDTSSVSVSLDRTDTASLQTTDTSSVAVSTETFPVTDTASIAVNDSATVNVFTGVLALSVTDDAFIGLDEDVLREDARVVSRIMFQAFVPKITFRRI